MEDACEFLEDVRTERGLSQSSLRGLCNLIFDKQKQETLEKKQNFNIRDLIN